MSQAAAVEKVPPRRVVGDAFVSLVWAAASAIPRQLQLSQHLRRLKNDGRCHQLVAAIFANPPL